MFVDEVTIYIKAGDGGNGSVAFRREKFVPNGGPAGGDGGRGGDIIFVVDPGLNTLMDFRHQRHFRAPHGEAGGNNRRHGKDGDDIMVKVPPGTLVTQENGDVLADLIEPGESAVIARGGRGGKGNTHFVSSTHRAPKVAERGHPGEEGWIKLDLNLLADVGLVGFPNAGKSTLISVVSAARPKIADYPFTTLVPNLGVVADYGDPFVVADVPGLIEGAHAGAGLGDTFLRHLKRTRILLHLVDMSPERGVSPLEEYRVIQEELRSFSPDLAARPLQVVGTKIDVAESRATFDAFRRAVAPVPVMAISAVTGDGVADLMWYVRRLLDEYPAVPQVRRDVTVRPAVRGFRVAEAEEGGVRIVGDVEERAQITLWGNPDAEAYFMEYLRRRGVPHALRRAKVADQSPVHVGEGTFYFVEGDLTMDVEETSS